MKMPSNVIKFSAENGLKVFHEVFADYWNERRTRAGIEGLSFSTVDEGGNPLNFDRKEENLNRMFKQEVCRLSKIGDMSEFGMAQYATNPNVVWTAFAIINSTIDYILPVTLLDSMKAYADIKTGGYGDSFKFNVKPRDLFPVTKASRNKRTAELQRQYNGTVTLVPENHMITVYVSLYRVLNGEENLSDFVAKAVISLQNEMLYDVYNAFNVAMTALPTTPTDGELKFVGYSQANLTKLIQRVKAFNGGAKPIILGTLLALQPILPSSANFRFDLESQYVRLGYIPNFLGADVVVLDQIADWKNPYKLLLNDSNIYVVSPGNQKIVKLVTEGDTITNASGVFDNADLSQTTTLSKSWIAGVVTNSIGGIIVAS